MRCHYIPGKFSEARRRRRPKSDPLLRTITCHIMSQMRIQTHTCSDARRVATAPRWCRAAATPELELTRNPALGLSHCSPRTETGRKRSPLHPLGRSSHPAARLSDFGGWAPDSTQPASTSPPRGPRRCDESWCPWFLPRSQAGKRPSQCHQATKAWAPGIRMYLLWAAQWRATCGH